MYGDTSAIRAQARRMRERAEELRAEADALATQVAGVTWSGLAAEAMRHVTGQHLDGLRRCAAAHLDAAVALEHHAHEVDRTKALITAIERRVLGVLDSARSGLGGLVDHIVPDAVGRWARDFEPPPPGSIAWLDVDVPGRA